MIRKETVLVLFLSLLSLSCADNEIKDIISRMDAIDKCGQMTQVTFDVIQKDNIMLNDEPVDPVKLKKAIHEYRVGSILNTPIDIAQKGRVWHSVIKQMHDETLNTVLKIPVIYGIDSIHGANYIQEAILFPQPLAQGASFNTELAEKIGEIVAKETRAAGIPWNFSPVMDVARQPLWPR
jgi:beta-glucosidase